MTDSPELPSPAPILQLVMAFYGSQALITAIELDVFSQLSGEFVDIATAEATLGLHPRGSRDFLDALVALGLLDRSSAGYRASTAARTYLDRTKPTYVGGYAMMAKHYLMPVWRQLGDAVRTGEPQVPTEGGFFDGYQDMAAARTFLGAMDAVNGKVGHDLTEAVDWSAYTSFVDVGGARGNLAAMLVNQHPGLSGTVFDMPDLLPFFDEHMTQLGLAERIGFAAGDFFADPLPSADVHILGHVLHYFGDTQRRQILESVCRAVNSGGGVAIYDRMIDEERRERPLSLLGSLNMLLTSPSGREYTPSELHGWLKEAGFEVRTTRPIGGTDVLVFAVKP